MTTTSSPPAPPSTIEKTTTDDIDSNNIENASVDNLNGAYTARLIASTGSTYNGSILNSVKNELQDIRDNYLTNSELPDEVKVRLLERRKISFQDSSERNVFKTVQWTPDGTSLITTSEDDGLRLFIIPPDLLEPRPLPLHLKPYTISSAPFTIYSTAIYPHFTLSVPATALVLTSTPNRPITLTSVLHPPTSNPYPILCSQTERYLPAYSLLFTPSNPNTFLAGSESKLCLFDITRPGQVPVSVMPTTPSKKAPLNTTRMKGLVSAMACSNEGVLAAGTFSSCIGLYDAEGSGATISTFTLPPRTSPYTGEGVTSLAWSPCGRYLYVLQRKTSAILIYDVRATGGMCGVFEGVRAGGNQRIAMEVAESWGGRVLVGGDDGWVRVWDQAEGEQTVGGWEVGGGTVTGVGVHPSGGVVATAGGRRWFAPDDDRDGSVEEGGSDSEDEEEVEAENALKIWTF